MSTCSTTMYTLLCRCRIGQGLALVALSVGIFLLASCQGYTTEKEQKTSPSPKVVDQAAAANPATSETTEPKKNDPTEIPAVKWMLKPRPVKDADAKTEAEMKPYTEEILSTPVKFDMVPIPGGQFTMGSPASEEGREKNEGPQRKVAIDPFWMGKCEVTWEEYEQWGMELDIERRLQNNMAKQNLNEYNKLADAIARPSRPYSDMTFGMGRTDRPAVCMTQLAAKMYCKWLTAKTGRYYRLPTEAEWEYAARAGTKTAYSFGDDPDDLDDYGWYYDNSDEKFQKVGRKKPNPWGLYDMHGNVAEWVLDQLAPYEKSDKLVKNPFVAPKTIYPRCVRGGSWDDDPEGLRSAARRGSEEDWKMQDPQIPQSIWYHTDATYVGFRVVRPLKKPTPEQAKLYEPEVEILREYFEAQLGKK